METNAMSDSRDRTFAKKFLFAFLAAIALVIGFNFAIDPYFCYRKSGLMWFFSFDQTTSPAWNYGLVKQGRGYDAIWVGSSLSTHMDVNYLNERMGVNCLPAIQASGRPNLYEKFITNARKKNDLKYVFYETCLPHWCFGRLEGLEFDESFIPEYIKTDTILDDWDYLLGRKTTEESLAIVVGFLQLRLGNFFRKKSGGGTGVSASQAGSIMPENTQYSTRAMSKFIHSDIKYLGYHRASLQSFFQNGQNTVDRYIIPLLEKNPYVEFIFVIPPTGAIVHSIFYNGGMLGEYMSLAAMLYTKLLMHPNARIIACDLDRDYNTNTDHYMDAGHYEPSGGKMMVDFIADGKYEITAANLVERLQEYMDMAENFEWPFLKRGFVGPQVADLQDKLVALGYDIELSGRYDKETEAAVRDFQQKNGIEPDGLAFPETLKRLAELAD